VSAHYGRKLDGRHLDGSMAFAKALLDRVAVAVTPGIAFGEDRCVRISFATSMERLREGIARMRRALG
jgi:aspartate aminotransferase